MFLMVSEKQNYFRAMCGTLGLTIHNLKLQCSPVPRSFKVKKEAKMSHSCPHRSRSQGLSSKLLGRNHWSPLGKVIQNTDLGLTKSHKKACQLCPTEENLCFLAAVARTWNTQISPFSIRLPDQCQLWENIEPDATPSRQEH